jgi:hypothetical protein
MMVKVARPFPAQPNGEHAVAGFTLHDPRRSGRGITPTGWRASRLLLQLPPPFLKGHRSDGMNGGESALNACE